MDRRLIKAEIQRINVMRKAELRTLWREMFKSDPPKAFGPDLLRRSLAYKIQERALGGLSPRAKSVLAEAIRQINRRPSARIELPRRIKSGAVLIREWKGTIYRVTVVEDRFLYDGKIYSSLSEIALLITGTKWIGPRFFGLRPSAKGAVAETNNNDTVAPKRHRGRPRKSDVGPKAVGAGAGQ